jgi:hypothetical protein
MSPLQPHPPHRRASVHHTPARPPLTPPPPSHPYRLRLHYLSFSAIRKAAILAIAALLVAIICLTSVPLGGGAPEGTSGPHRQTELQAKDALTLESGQRDSGVGKIVSYRRLGDESVRLSGEADQFVLFEVCFENVRELNLVVVISPMFVPLGGDATKGHVWSAPPDGVASEGCRHAGVGAARRRGRKGC